MDRGRDGRPFDLDGRDEQLEDEAPAPRLSVGKRSLSSHLRQGGAPPEQTPVVFRSARGAGAPARPPADRVLGVSVAGGDRLPGALLGRLGEALGQDVSGVRIHTGTQSAAAADALAANAFTVGKDIHFAEGAYQPDSADGQRLIAHEVAHTVQQSTGAAPPAAQTQLRMSTPGDAFEQEADRFADSFVGGGGPAHVAAGSAGAMISRDGKDTSYKTAEYFNKGGVETVRANASGLLLSIGIAEAEAKQVLDNAKGKVLGFAGSYREAWKKFESQLAKARAEAKNQQAWKDFAEELALAVLAAATAGVALEVLGLVEVIEAAGAGVRVAVAVGKGLAEKGMTDAAHSVAHGPKTGGTDLEATGVTPDALEMKSYKSVADLAAALGRLAPAGNSVSNLAAAAEYCIGEIKANMGAGTGGDMSENEVLDMSGSVVRAGVFLTQAKAALDKAKVKMAGARAVNEATPEMTTTEVEKQIWTKWMAEQNPDDNIIDLDAIEDYLRGLGLVTKVSIWYSDADEANDIDAAKKRLRGMNDQKRAAEKAQRAAEKGADDQIKKANDAAKNAPDAPDASKPVGDRKHQDAEFRKPEVESARGIAASTAAKITIIDTKGQATLRNLADAFGTYSRNYNAAWNSYASVLAAGGKSAKKTEEWINRISGYALAGLTAGVFHGGEHIAHSRHWIGKAIEHVGTGPWAAKTVAEKGTEGLAHKGVHAHAATEGKATGVTPDAVNATTYKRMLELSESLASLSSDRLGVGMVLGAAEYCLGEIKGWLAGGSAEMTEEEVIMMAGSVITACGELNGAPLAAVESSLSPIDEAANHAREVSALDLEKQMFILWMSEQDINSDVTDIDPIQEHLEKLGIIKHRTWYSDDDARKDLKRARRDAAGVQGEREELGVPGEDKNDAGGDPHGGGH